MLRRYPFVFVFLVTALLICCAYYWHLPYDLRYDTEADYPDTLRTFRAHVQEPPVRKQKGWLLSVSLPEHSQQALLYLKADSAEVIPAIGDLLLVRTRITRPHALFKGDFDYGHYLRLQHKVGIGYVQPQHWRRIGHTPVRTLRARAATVQQALSQRLADAGLHDQPLALMSAVIVGERDALDSDIRQSFAAAGAAHILAVSGLHTGIIYLVIVSLLTCFGYYRPLYEQRIRRVVLSLIIILTMWVYAFVTGLSPSVMRAVTMLTIIQVGWMFRRHAISVNTLAAAACICLWADPLSLFNVSFQLSFAAVLGIMLLVPYMNSLWEPYRYSLRFLRDLFTVSLAATIGTLPVTLYYFSQVSRYFLLTNLMIIPAAYILVTVGALTLLLAHTVVGTWLAVVLQHVSSGLCDFVGWIEHLPYATLQLSVTPWMVVCLVVAIASCYLRIRQQDLVWLAPATAAVALFCVLHIYNTRQSLSDHALAIRGKTLYYNHGGAITTYTTNSRYAFFRFDSHNYVYAPYLSDYTEHALRQYCIANNISIWENN